MKKAIILLVVGSLMGVQFIPVVSQAQEQKEMDQIVVDSERNENIDGSSEVQDDQIASEGNPFPEEATTSESSVDAESVYEEQEPIFAEQGSQAAADATEVEDSMNEIVQASDLDTVIIPDLTLRKLINTKLNHTADWETYAPTKQELASIKGIFRLDFNSSNVAKFTSLEGIQYLTGISELYSYYAEFADLSDLNLISQLTQLTYISMGNTNIDSMEFASELPNLTGMVLGANRISDVSRSIDYYNSPKRKQYNFINQTITSEVMLEAGQTIIDPIRIIGIDGNPVQISLQNTGGRFTLENGKFVGNNLVPGQTYVINYTFVDTSITHAGRLTGSAKLTVRVPLVAGAEVTIRYEDDKGTELSSPDILSGNIGDPYTSGAKEFPGYTLKEVLGAPSGQISDVVQEVKYVYTKDPVPGAEVTIRYEDDEGEELSSPDILSGNIGDPYTSEAKEFPGYTLKEVLGAPSGQISDIAQEVKYVYTKDSVPGEQVTIRYEDDKGEELSSPDIRSGNIGDPYTSEAKEFPGYTLKEVLGAPSGQISDVTQEVKYVYTKDLISRSTVLVYYKDEAGMTLAPSQVLNGNIGETYASKELSISGYTLKEVKGDPKGIFTDSTQEVTYVYKKNQLLKSEVIVHYVDEAGKELAPSQILTGNIGDVYTSEARKISNYTLKEVKGVSTGRFTDEIQEVTYVYAKVIMKSETNESNTLKETKTRPNSGVEQRRKQSYPTEKKQLPKTGEEKNLSKSLTILGLSLLMFSVIAFDWYRKKENN